MLPSAATCRRDRSSSGFAASERRSWSSSRRSTTRRCSGSWWRSASACIRTTTARRSSRRSASSSMSKRPCSSPAATACSTVRARRASPFTRSTLVDLLHLVVLSSLAVAQPLFDLLGKNAEFFAAHDSGALDILVFAFAVLLLPPLALFIVELLVGLVDERTRAVIHALFVGGLAALFVVQALKKRTELTTGRWALCAV